MFLILTIIIIIIFIIIIIIIIIIITIIIIMLPFFSETCDKVMYERVKFGHFQPFLLRNIKWNICHRLSLET